MKTNLFLVFVLVLVIIGGIFYFNKRKKAATPTGTQTNPNNPDQNGGGTATATNGGVNIVNPQLPTEPTIKPLTKDEIKLWQGFLLNKGYNLGNTGIARNGVDGIWGEYTTAATYDFTGKKLINSEELQFWLKKDFEENFLPRARTAYDSVKSKYSLTVEPVTTDPLIKVLPKEEFPVQYVLDKTAIRAVGCVKDNFGNANNFILQ
jgi:hypothetical protein